MNYFSTVYVLYLFYFKIENKKHNKIKRTIFPKKVAKIHNIYMYICTYQENLLFYMLIVVIYEIKK